jgi:drug/metabolite transporter (DMT)-like permease
MYYAIVLFSVVMFGGCFALNDVYRKWRSSHLVSSMENACFGSLAGLTVLLAISGFDFQVSPFTLGMAFLASLSTVAFAFFSFKALDSTNLSLYSLFAMLGGMVLPFFQGILFYGEKITVAKIICVVLICIALLLTVSRNNNKKGTVYYIGVFILNGMMGVLSKIFVSAPFEKTSAQWYSIWIAVFTSAISGVLWLILSRKHRLPRYTVKAFGVSALSGSLNQVANFLLVIALAHLDASVQYPMVTGGVIIVSTCICFFGKNKPSTRELLSVCIAFLGLMILCLFS